MGLLKDNDQVAVIGLSSRRIIEKISPDGLFGDDERVIVRARDVVDGVLTDPYEFTVEGKWDIAAIFAEARESV